MELADQNNLAAIAYFVWSQLSVQLYTVIQTVN